MRDTNRVEWMSRGNYGLMVHYLYNPKGNTIEEKCADFNKTINNFNLNRFMSYIDTCDPAWLIFPISQNYGYYIGPNEYIDKYAPNHTSKRDLILEIGKEMKKRGKHFICYLPGEVCVNSLNHPEFYNAFKWIPNDLYQKDFFIAWEQVLRNYSIKYGKYCDGWWIDGCYDSYTHGNWDWSVWAKALRSGNPNSALAFSDGSFCIDTLKNISDENDYFPGEVTACQNGQIRLDKDIFDFVVNDEYKDYRMTKEGYAPTKYGVKLFEPKEKYLDNSLLHALVPFDTLWCIDFNFDTPWINYSSNDLIKLVKSFNNVGGAVTLNAPIFMEDGEIPQESIDKLIELKNALRY